MYQASQPFRVDFERGNREEGAARVLLRCTASAMARHLTEISQAAAPRARAFVLLDHARWHTAANPPSVDQHHPITQLPVPQDRPCLTRSRISAVHA